MNNNNKADNIIILNDENGNDASFKFLDQYNIKEPNMLYYIEESNEAGEVVILMVENISGEEESYISIDDEETLIAVFKDFQR